MTGEPLKADLILDDAFVVLQSRPFFHFNRVVQCDLVLAALCEEDIKPAREPVVAVIGRVLVEVERLPADAGPQHATSIVKESIKPFLSNRLPGCRRSVHAARLGAAG